MYNSNIAKLICKLNFAKRGHYKTIKIKYTKFLLSLIELLEDLGIIRGFILNKYDDNIKIFMKYKRGGQCIFFEIKQISKSSKRIYVTLLGLYKLKNRTSKVVYILSTSKGIMIDSECLRNRLGGEVLFKVVM